MLQGILEKISETERGACFKEEVTPYILFDLAK